MSSGSLSLDLGVELDFALEPKNEILPQLKSLGFSETPNSSEKKAGNRKAIRDFLATSITEKRVPTSTHAEEHDKWTVTDNETIFETLGTWRCSLVSNTLKSENNWAEELSKVFSAVENGFIIKPNRDCSMRVYVSLRHIRFNISERKQIRKSVAYYDRTMRDFFLPPDRRYSPFCLPNTIAIPDWDNAYKAVPSCTWGSSLLEVASDETTDKDNHRYCMWNFNRMIAGIVEFRGPPGIQSSSQAEFWVFLGLGFIAQALKKDWDSIRKSNVYPTSADLINDLKRGMDILGRPGLKSLVKLPSYKNEQLPNEPTECEKQWDQARRKMLDSRPNYFVLKWSKLPESVKVPGLPPRQKPLHVRDGSGPYASLFTHDTASH